MKKYHKFTFLFAILSLSVSAQTDSANAGITANPRVYVHNRWGIDFSANPGIYYCSSPASSKIHAEEAVIIMISINIDRIYLHYSRIELTGTITGNLGYGNQFKPNFYLNPVVDEFGIGYRCYLAQRLHCIPFASVGSVYFVGSPNISENLEFETTSRYFNWSLKSAFDYVLFPNKSYFKHAKDQGKFFGSAMARIIIGYNPRFFEQPFNINGGIIYATVGLALGVGE